MSAPAERRASEVIAAKWRVDSLLGSGSMASVYAVTHRNGARAALKILHPSLCADPSVCERFLGEGYLTNAVKHAGIVRVLDDGVTDDGCVFLVMDLLEGQTLEAYREQCGGQIPLVTLLDIADRLMDVLHAVHQAGIIHRDLKLQNVFVCNDGTVKLLDFGIARLFDRDAQKQLSMHGLVLGTPSFMSPEQALGSRDKVDHRSDIWSLGATLFTALTGQTVHLGPNLQAKLIAAASARARSIALVKQDLPPAIASAIDRALRFEKEERWQSVDAFRRALRDARSALGLPKPESVPPPGLLGDDQLPRFGEELAEGYEKTVVADFRATHGDVEPTTLPHMRAAAPVGAPAARTPMESLPDASYTALGATVRGGGLTAQVGAPASNMGTWIAGAIVAGVIAGGAGFYAMRGASAKNGPQAPLAQPVATVDPSPARPTLPPVSQNVPSVDTPPVASATARIEPKEARDAGGVTQAPPPVAVPTASPRAVPPPPVARPVERPQNEPVAPPEAPPAPPPAPKPLDPFDTPQ